MSATDTNSRASGQQGTEEHHEAHHPTPAQYVQVAVVLAILTFLEFTTYLVDFGVLGVPLLIVLMLIKFVLVAGWFMHLKFDTRVYTRFMVTGLVLAFALYAVTLLLFRYGHFPYA